MAEQSLQARICSKYDTYENWSNMNTIGRGGNLILKQGEIGICFVPNEADPASPTVLFKIGDGSTIFANLPWGSALSADVYDWAKAETKPTYTAAEVGALPANTVIPTVPTALKNPNALTFTGAVTGDYDGSSAKTVNIPAAVTVDSSLSTSSTNPVQNKVVKSAIDKKADENTETLAWYGYNENTNYKNLADVILNLHQAEVVRLRAFMSNSTIVSIEGSSNINTSTGFVSPDFLTSAIDGTIPVELFLIDKDTDKFYTLRLVYSKHNGEKVIFSGLDEDENPIALVGTITYSSSGEPSWSSWSLNKYIKVPSVTTANNGQFLRVVNGVPAWVSLTNVAEEGA